MKINVKHSHFVVCVIIFLLCAIYPVIPSADTFTSVPANVPTTASTSSNGIQTILQTHYIAVVPFEEEFSSTFPFKLAFKSVIFTQRNLYIDLTAPSYTFSYWKLLMATFFFLPVMRDKKSSILCIPLGGHAPPFLSYAF